jgi:hypothetical protein
LVLEYQIGEIVRTPKNLVLAGHLLSEGRIVVDEAHDVVTKPALALHSARDLTGLRVGSEHDRACCVSASSSEEVEHLADDESFSSNEDEPEQESDDDPGSRELQIEQ